MKNMKLLLATLIASCALPAFAQPMMHHHDGNMSYPHKMCDQANMHKGGAYHHKAHHANTDAKNGYSPLCPYASKGGDDTTHGKVHRFMHQPYYDDPDFIYVKAMVDLPQEFHSDVKKLQALKDELFVKKQVLRSLRNNPSISASRVENAAREVIAARSALREFNIVFHKRMAEYYSNQAK